MLDPKYLAERNQGECTEMRSRETCAGDGRTVSCRVGD